MMGTRVRCTDNRGMSATLPPPTAHPPATPWTVGRPLRWLAAAAVATLLGGCDMLGIDTPAKQAERREADGRAIGAGCRHTQRSLEDCYAANPKAPKAAIFAGWREMDEYMRENNIPSAAPPAPPPAAPAEKEEIIAPQETAPAAAKDTPAAAPAPTPPAGSIVPRLAPPTPAR